MKRRELASPKQARGESLPSRVKILHAVEVRRNAKRDGGGVLSRSLFSILALGRKNATKTGGDTRKSGGQRAERKNGNRNRMDGQSPSKLRARQRTRDPRAVKRPRSAFLSGLSVQRKEMRKAEHTGRKPTCPIKTNGGLNRNAEKGGGGLSVVREISTHRRHEISLGKNNAGALRCAD